MDKLKVFDQLVMKNYEGRRRNYGNLMPSSLADHLNGATRYYYFFSKELKTILGLKLTPACTFCALDMVYTKTDQAQGF